MTTNNSKYAWWQNGVIYQIYPRSFMDSNGDGIGDLNGVIERLDYLSDTIGVDAIWLSPIFPSPMADFGYDVADYCGIHPLFGSMADFDRLLEETHKRGKKLLLDLVPNHTSDEHPWFLESRSSRDNPKHDWYIWRDPAPDGGMPNNWLSHFGGPAWTFDEKTGQYYLHLFAKQQPDLNYRNPEVKRTMLDMVRFWLGKGVDGFRLDIFNYIYKGAEFQNNPFSFKLIPSEEDYSGFFQEAKYTVNLPESFEFAKEFRSTCNEFGERLSVGEVTGGKRILRKFLGDGETNNGLTLVFDFAMMNFKFTAEYFSHLIREMESHYPSPFMPVYVFSNHDKSRSMERLGGDMRKAKLLALVQLSVRGVPCLYYGEEIGMTDLKFPLKTALDPIAHKFTFIPRFILDRLGVLVNRDEVRTPMQWDATRNAGFSSAQKTWLPVNENFSRINVEREHSEQDSLLSTVKALLEIRNKENALQEGSLQILENLPKDVLGYQRTTETQKMIVLINFSEQKREFPVAHSGCVFKLSEQDDILEAAIRLNGFGGVILKGK